MNTARQNTPDEKAARKAFFLGRFLHLRALDVVYVSVMAVSVLVASRVGAAVHTEQDVDTCMLGNLDRTATVPSCAPTLVKDRGHYYSVLLGITSAARVARQQSNPNIGDWCALQASALRAYKVHSAYSQLEQSLWMTDADAQAVAAAPAVCL